MLFVYAATFSYAYISLDTGTGALILFCAVQMTMIVTSLCLGNRLRYIEWLGVATAFAGFVYLMLPSVGTPSLFGFMLMALSGIAWGFYTLAGQRSENPLRDTTYNFFRTVPFILLLLPFMAQPAALTYQGIILAVISGSIASGLGYTIWYLALKGLSTTQAAVVQLSVPLIAAIGGVVFTNEVFSIRMAISSLMILGGILVVVVGKHVTTYLGKG